MLFYRMVGRTIYREKLITLPDHSFQNSHTWNLVHTLLGLVSLTSISIQTDSCWFDTDNKSVTSVIQNQPLKHPWFFQSIDHPVEALAFNFQNARLSVLCRKHLKFRHDNNQIITSHRKWMCDPGVYERKFKTPSRNCVSWSISLINIK